MLPFIEETLSSFDRLKILAMPKDIAEKFNKARCLILEIRTINHC